MDNENTTFRLVIRSREGLVYEGEVKSITSVNETGKFDILAQHANFITLIQSVVEIGEMNGEKKQLKIENGLLRSRENNVEVYLGISGISKQNS
jgi:F0F1-type ATP synthase epsilon subunit